MSCDSPKRITSPCASTCSVARTPLTNVPSFDSGSRSRHTPSTTAISAWFLDTPMPTTRMSLSVRRPSVMSGLVYGDPPSAVRVGDDQTRVPVAHVVLVLSTLIHRPWQSAREAEADIVQ